ncbi:hypothetical protein HRR83_009030 [Exophiala dermatitidis]|nr:hypothetical protein HRR76_009591 [Exophiala dermatitidis]KAJ4533204.1 hypothetical protein HRR77_008915 [Exophiala dermatitidis]KAJ4555898.1 hypothetical protein HRR79_008994 [Exophiala dermatitidis]KAJ4587175.1 hypothetical protein HRR83_009030 [Exophiala dermatitidis]KAJ4588972.1 hypothetical protein HRR84_008159 [Exophiala dermatitidis]
MIDQTQRSAKTSAVFAAAASSLSPYLGIQCHTAGWLPHSTLATLLLESRRAQTSITALGSIQLASIEACGEVSSKSSVVDTRTSNDSQPYNEVGTMARQSTSSRRRRM